MGARRRTSLVVLVLGLTSLVGALVWSVLRADGAREPLDALHEENVASRQPDHVQLEEAQPLAIEARPESSRQAVASTSEWTLRVFGRVSAKADKKLPLAAKIDVVVREFRGERSLVHPPVTCDESGAYAFQVTFDESWGDTRGDLPNLQVELAVWAPGYASELKSCLVDPGRANELKVDFGLESGADVWGHVYGADGSPAEAYVYFQLGADEDRIEVQTDEDGAYRLQLERGGTAIVHARGESAGTAQIEGLRIDPSVSTQVPDMFLSGSGVIGGVLVDPSGDAIAAHSISVVFDELLMDGGEPEEDWTSVSMLSDSNFGAERGDGLLFDTQTTRADGSFLFKGLRLGRYWVFTHHELEAHPHEAPRVLHTTGELDVRLVQGVYRLAVIVRSPPQGRYVHCTELVGEEGSVFGGIAVSAPLRIGVDPLMFDVQPNRTYSVGLGDGSPHTMTYTFGKPPPGPWDVATAEARVSIEEGRYLTTVELEPDSGPGRLLIDIEDDQTPFSYGVQIRHAASGHRVKSGYISKADLPLLILLAPGEYRVEVDSSGRGGLSRGASIASMVLAEDGKPSKSEFHVDSSWRVVDVSASGQTSLHFDFEEGGRLVIIRPRDIAAIVPPPETIRFDGNYTWLRGGQPASQFEIENAMGARNRDLHFMPMRRTPDGAHVVSLTKAWSQLKRALPAGSYTLRWKVPGGQLVEVPFQIQSGEWTTVELQPR